MTAKQLFLSTLPFVWAKMALGGAMILISGLLLAILMGLGWLFGDTAMVIAFCLWIGSLGAINFVIMHYFGYLLKAGHIAVIARACLTGKLPRNQIAYGKRAVQKRFATSNVYFAVDKLVSGAVKQIQQRIGKVSDFLDFIPGIEVVASAMQFFVSISLGYIDECCLGWTFYHTKQSAFKSAADGVVIYAQNWKTLLKDAAMTMIKVILGTVVLALIIFVPIGLIFKLLYWNGMIAFALACMIAWVVKFAVMDSYMMIEMMASYMSVAPQTTLAFDLYANLAAVSPSFKELWNKGRISAAEQSQANEDAPYTAPEQRYTRPDVPVAAPEQPSAQTQAPIPTMSQPAAQITFCSACGAKNRPSARFCGGCGAKLTKEA